MVEVKSVGSVSLSWSVGLFDRARTGHPNSLGIERMNFT